MSEAFPRAFHVALGDVMDYNFDTNTLENFRPFRVHLMAEMVHVGAASGVMGEAVHWRMHPESKAGGALEVDAACPLHATLTGVEGAGLYKVICETKPGAWDRSEAWRAANPTADPATDPNRDHWGRRARCRSARTWPSRSPRSREVQPISRPVRITTWKATR